MILKILSLFNCISFTIKIPTNVINYKNKISVKIKKMINIIVDKVTTYSFQIINNPRPSIQPRASPFF